MNKMKKLLLPRKGFKISRRSCSSQSAEKTSEQSLCKKPVKEILRDSSPLKSNLNAGEFATSAYPDGTIFSQYSQAERTLRPKCDPRDTSIILFPGQGTQYLGMARSLLKYPIARDMFDAASQILGYDLLKICEEGPAEKLARTEYSQPAVVVSSLATIEKLKEEKPDAINNCIATAGFSVGEISALVFAGCLSFERGIQLVKARAEAMQLCSEMVPSGMMTVLLSPDSELGQAMKDAKDHCASLRIEKPVCEVANYLYPHCKVIAGHDQALDFVAKNAQKYKIQRSSRLRVSGAFHTRLMEPAADAVYQVLRKCTLNDPIITVHSNVSGARYVNARHILRYLPRQVYQPVKWEQIMHILYERPGDEAFPFSYECGPGFSLKTILKRVNFKAAKQCTSVMQTDFKSSEE